MATFLTFGDDKFEESLRRIEREAAASGYFDKVRIRRPADLSGAFWRKHGGFVAGHRRGYGFWIWKPWIIAEELSAGPPGEILVYADAGCTINGRGRRRFEEYRRLLKASPSGVLSFRLPYEERRFTKGDAFEALNAWHLKDTSHISATVICWRRCEESLQLARDWLSFAERYELLSDTSSVAPNDTTFIEHRHDQSLLSLLLKLREATVIDDETHFEDWNEADAAPFWATRLKGAGVGGLERQARILFQRARHIF